MGLECGSETYRYMKQLNELHRVLTTTAGQINKDNLGMNDRSEISF